MKRTTSLAVVFVMTLALSMPVFGGDMPGPGIYQAGGNLTSTDLAMGEPLGGQSAEDQSGYGPSEATPDAFDQAMIIAIQLLFSIR